ncbi:MAG: hypothetical protein AB1430_03110 [Pseudomonadota bacterium]
MRTRSSVHALMALCCAGAPAWAASGLNVDAEQVPWPRLQARIGLATSTPLSTDLVSAGQLQGGRVLGDYYFTQGPLLGSARVSGGFRATSGLLLGSRGASMSMPSVPRMGDTFNVAQQGLRPASEAGSDPSQALPYLGVGYTGLSLKGGWGFTADLGLMAVPAAGSGLRVGRSTAGSASLDDTLRELRLTPVLQLGLSYSF